MVWLLDRPSERAAGALALVHALDARPEHLDTYAE